MSDWPSSALAVLEPPLPYPCPILDYFGHNDRQILLTLCVPVAKVMAWQGPWALSSSSFCLSSRHRGLRCHLSPKALRPGP